MTVYNTKEKKENTMAAKYFSPSDIMELLGKQSKRKIFGKLLPDEFLEIPLTDKIFKLHDVYSPNTFYREYIEDPIIHDDFMTPRSYTITEGEAKKIAEYITPELLLKMEEHLKKYAGEFQWIKEEGENAYFEQERYQNRLTERCKQNLKLAGDNSERKLVILVLHSIFQKECETEIQEQLNTYLENSQSHKENRKPKKQEITLRGSKEEKQRRKWDEKPLFLEKCNPGDTPKYLKDVHVPSSYCEGDFIASFKNDKNRERRKSDIEKYITGIIDESKNPKLSLILGSPGIGKSTLFTYFLNWDEVKSESKGGKYYFHGRRIYLYRFCDLNEEIEWKKRNKEIRADYILEQMLEIMTRDDECSPEDLDNTILLLDGFDECSASPDQRRELLSEMADRWGEYARIFVTCRHSYISVRDYKDADNISCISLQTFDEEQMLAFGKKYREKIYNQVLEERIEDNAPHILEERKGWNASDFLGKILSHIGRKRDKSEKNEEQTFFPESARRENKEENLSENLEIKLSADKLDVYGIPIVWYMILALELPQGEETSIGTIYEKIFDEKGGVYKRQLEACSYDLVDRNTGHKKIHIEEDQLPYYIRHLSKVSREIAYYMFQVNKEDVPLREIRKILKEKKIVFLVSGEEVDFRTILSSGMFMYIDSATGEEEDSSLRFVHRSMYEYFMADYIAHKIVKFYIEKNIGKAHRDLSEIFDKGNITEAIAVFLEQRFANPETIRKTQGDFSCMESLFENMLCNGMSIYLPPENKNEISQKIKEILSKEIYFRSIGNIDETQADQYINHLSEALYNLSQSGFQKSVLGNMKDETREIRIFENVLWLMQIYRKAIGAYGNKKGYLFKENTQVKEIFPRYMEMKQRVSEKHMPLDLTGMNLSGMDLSDLKLARYNFSYANAKNVNFRRSDLKGANFTETVLEGAAFTGANLIMTTPKAEELFDAQKRGIPWTEFTGYYPEQYVDEKGYTYEGQKVYKGATIKFGRYPQESNDKENRTPIEWRVLEVRGNRALLLSKKILDQKRYNEEWEETSWETCTLRKWLNGREERGGEREFLSEANFSQKEREKICKTLVEPHKNINPKDYETEQGKATEDQVFLLSGEEVAKYFALRMEETDGFWEWYSMGGEQALGRTTEYAHSKGLNASGKADFWWLRSVGFSVLDAVSVNHGGVNAFGHTMDSAKVGVRPALWISLKS